MPLFLRYFLRLVFVIAALEIGLTAESYFTKELKKPVVRDSIRVLCIGDSISGTYPRLLETTLNQNSDHQVQVFTKIDYRSTPLEFANQLKSALIEVRPHVVITMIGLSELAKNRELFQGKKDSSLARFLVHSRLLRAMSFFVWHNSTQIYRTYFAPPLLDSNDLVALIREGNYSAASRELVEKSSHLTTETRSATYREFLLAAQNSGVPSSEILTTVALELDKLREDRSGLGSDLGIELNKSQLNPTNANQWLKRLTDNYKLRRVLRFFKYSLDKNLSELHADRSFFDHASVATFLFQTEGSVEQIDRDFATYEQARSYLTDGQESWPRSIFLAPQEETLIRLAVNGQSPIEKQLGLYFDLETLVASYIERLERDHQSERIDQLKRRYTGQSELLDHFFENDRDLPNLAQSVSGDLATAYRVMYEHTKQFGALFLAMQYPGYQIDHLKTLFTGRDRPLFVDQSPSFASAVKKNGYLKYFYDIAGHNMGHLTPRGDKLLVTNILQELAPLLEEMNKRTQHR